MERLSFKTVLKTDVISDFGTTVRDLNSLPINDHIIYK